MSNSFGLGVILLVISAGLIGVSLTNPSNCTADYDAGRARGISTTLSMLDAVSINSRDLQAIEKELDR
jgi:hypothetical protein